MNGYRHEKKVLIPGIFAEEAESILRLHPACFSSAYPPRAINNIYFDERNFKYYYDAVEGENRRVKVRIRWYGPLFGNIPKPVLELKYKIGLLGKKECFPLVPFEVKEGFSRQTVQDVFAASQLPFSLKEWLVRLECTLLNTYRREYFITRDNNFRITLDRGLEYWPLRPHDNSFFGRQKWDSHLVMELKYSADQSTNADRIANYFPFRISRNSKYSVGVESVYSWVS